jgi:signal transduction histidine kinase
MTLRREAGLLTVVSLGLTLAVALSTMPVGFHAPALMVTLETSTSVIALLAAFLVVGRLRRDQRVDDLFLVCGLTVLALSNFGFGTVAAVSSSAWIPNLIWASVVAHLGGTALIAAAAFAPHARLRGGDRTLAVALVGCAAFVALAGLGLSLEPWSLGDAGGRGLDAVNVLSAGLFAAAFAGFARRFERAGDEFVRWLAFACIFSAFARVNSVLAPRASSGWVYVGDGFRLLFYAMLLVGALREIASYWRRLADAAVLEERRRIARELHDGLAQELAFLSRNLEALELHIHESIGRLRESARRAQDESRRAIHALTAREDFSLEAQLRRTVEELGDRFRAAIELRVEGAPALPPARAEALVRIAAEAITNAARHSGATKVSVAVRRSRGRWVLSVRDDGCGFEPLAPSSGFGLISMRERAEAVGGTFVLASAPARGTTVEVAI